MTYYFVIDLPCKKSFTPYGVYKLRFNYYESTIYKYFSMSTNYRYWSRNAWRFLCVGVSTRPLRLVCWFSPTSNFTQSDKPRHKDHTFCQSQKTLDNKVQPFCLLGCLLVLLVWLLVSSIGNRGRSGYGAYFEIKRVVGFLVSRETLVLLLIWI